MCQHFPIIHRSVTYDREPAANPALNRDGPWLIEDAPPAPVLNMARAAAGARLAATFR